MSDNHIVVHPADWAPPSGYVDAMVSRGRIVTLAGQIGWDPISCTFASDDFAEQVAQSLRNIVRLVNEAGGKPEHIVRLTWFITSRNEYFESVRKLALAYRTVMGKHYPPMSVVVVAGLLEPRAKVEIEATAVIPE